jgi:hypothetical protein
VSQDRLRGRRQAEVAALGTTQWIKSAFNIDPPTDQMSRNRRDFDK